MHNWESIGLRLYLMGLIFVIALLCLISTTAYFLNQSNLESRDNLANKAETIDKHLELQLFQIANGYKTYQGFPDLKLDSTNKDNSGLCIKYTAIEGNVVRSLCYGGLNSLKKWPDWFEKIYKWAFHPEDELVREIIYNKQNRATLTLTPDAEIEINRAWYDVKKLISLFTVTLSSLCIMLYFFLGRALKPVDVIISGLDNIAKGELSTRLPSFKIMEWQQTAKAINQLSTSLEKTLGEKNKLMLKLMNVQEEERRFLTRELHDEFGQCLTGQQAIAFSLLQTAKEKNQEQVEDCQNILDINNLMMDHLQNILQQLHPSNIEELGLKASLISLVSNWNARSSGKTDFTIELDNNIDLIPNSISSHLFRITQECLSNIVKHSKAKNAKVILEIMLQSSSSFINHSNDIITLTITDDGLANKTTFQDSNGIGLLGIRERIAALGGQITLSNNKPSGLNTQLWIPFTINLQK